MVNEGTGVGRERKEGRRGAGGGLSLPWQGACRQCATERRTLRRGGRARGSARAQRVSARQTRRRAGRAASGYRGRKSCRRAAGGAAAASRSAEV